MVAWMRKKYPHLVDGAWASSAPLHAQVDFFQYKEVMTSGITSVGGEDCTEIFEKAFIEMERLVESGNASRIQQVFSLCEPLDLTRDVHHFFFEVSDMVAGLVQGHRAGRIEGACNSMRRVLEDPTKDDLDAFATWVVGGSTACLDMSYQNMVTKFRNDTWGSEANRQMRQWTYQTCSEFAWFQTSSSNEQIFGSSYPLEYFINICEDLYDYS